MFGGLSLVDQFDGEGTVLEIDLPHERLDLLEGSGSVSLRFDPGFRCEFASSVTLTVLLEGPSPTGDALVVAPFSSSNEPNSDTSSLPERQAFSHGRTLQAGGAEARCRPRACRGCYPPVR